MKFAAATLLTLASVAVASPLFGGPAPTPTKATVAQIKQQLGVISSDASGLLTGLTKTDGTDYFADLALIGPANQLQADITTAYNEEQTLTPADVSEQDAADIFALLEQLEPTAKSLCARAAEIRPGFVKAGVYGIVQGIVQPIPDQVNKIGAATIALAPADYQVKGAALLAQYKSDLQVCTDAYSGPA